MPALNDSPCHIEIYSQLDFNDLFGIKCKMLIMRDVAKLIACAKGVPDLFVNVSVRVSINPVRDWTCFNILLQFYRKCSVYRAPLKS